MHVPAADPADKFRRGADFLFGVLIAVALEKAVEGFLHVAAHSWTSDPAAPRSESLPLEHPWSWLALLVFRMLAFTPMIASFYFGSIKYFDEIYGTAAPPSTDVNEFGRGFRVDLFSGIIHFALFYAWSLSVPALDKFIQYGGWSFSPFLMMFVFVLIYDFFWLSFRWLATRHTTNAAWIEHDKTTHKMIRSWAIRNLLIASWVVVVILVPWSFTHPIRSEALALLPVIFLSLRDFKKIVKL